MSVCYKFLKDSKLVFELYCLHEKYTHVTDINVRSTLRRRHTPGSW